jgi:TRAP-type C4-dicarboxylate transport system permease large subunit
MDVIPALTIMGPIFLPIAVSVGMDPLIFGMILIFGLVIGMITPPVGNVLYIGCGISNIQLLPLLKRIYPMVIAYIFVLFLITFFPQLITFLPDLVLG